MSNDPSRELAIITGGTSGIGLAIAEALLNRFDLALIHARDEARANAAQTRLTSLVPTAQVRTYRQELREHGGCAAVLEKIRLDFTAPVAVLVNCAGRLRDRLIMGSNFADHQTNIEEHLLVPMAMCHLVVPLMFKNKRGRILNIGSTAAQSTNVGQGSYAAAKAGIEAFTRSLAKEVGIRSITANVIAPGLIETALSKEYLAKLGDPHQHVALGAYGQPRDVGSVARFLCSPEADYITGAVLTVDGGLF